MPSKPKELLASTLSSRLKEAQLRSGISGKDLAKETGVSETTISNWRTVGSSESPRAFALARVAARLDVSMDWLLGLDPPPPHGRWILDRVTLDRVMEAKSTEEVRAALPEAGPFEAAAYIEDESEFVTRREADDLARRMWAHIEKVSPALAREMQGARLVALEVRA